MHGTPEAGPTPPQPLPTDRLRFAMPPMSLERSCQVQLTAKAAGRPVLIDHQAAPATREQLGGDLVAWINYQPMWQDIGRSEPDLLS